MRILGLETSCDDTGAAVIEDGRLLSNIIAGQLEHNQYGGVVPEVASRLHELNIYRTTEEALAAAALDHRELDGVAVTYGPGLAGALMVGLNFAKGLAQALDIPFVGVDHMEGHLWANFLSRPEELDDRPFLCLLVSGGHTHIWHVDGVGNYALVGATVDDAAGEAFDKGARLLGLSYPGGPAIQLAATDRDATAVKFPRPFAGTEHCNYSFSGLKTALYYYIQKLPAPPSRSQLGEIAAGYQAAIIDCLLDRLHQAVKLTGLKRVYIAGGVSANQLLRSRMDEWSAATDIACAYPPLEFCTDNAAMIGLAGYQRILAGQHDSLNLDINPNLRLDQIAKD
jgi:N6-L-threonylcarbamoyladenine synthase